MEPVAVAVEVIFGKILIVFDVVVSADFAGFGPSEGFNLDELDIRGEIVFFD